MHCDRVLSVLSLCFACTRTLPPASTAPKQESAARLDAMVDVGTLRLHLRCEGSGHPLVVFEAGLGLDASVWQRVQPEIASGTRACAYDRAGRGLSGPAPYPHDQRRMADELYALLESSGQPGPYVLVGHSMGGANVRWFQNAHPSTVAGMVLIEPATEDWPKRVLSQVPAEALPEFWRNLRAWEGLDADSYIAGYAGLRDLTSSLGDRPLVILTAANPPGELALRLEMHGALTRLSSNTLHVLVNDSAHNIQLDNPVRVVEAIQAVVHAARTRSNLSESAMATSALSVR